VSWGLAWLLAAFVIFVPPVFALAPLAVLLLVSRPTTGREWFWLVAGATVIALSLSAGAGLAAGFVRAVGVFGAGSFVALSLWRPERPLFGRAAGSAAIGLVAALFLSSLLGAGWDDIERTLARDLRGLFLTQARIAESRALGSGLVETLRQMADGAAASATFYPAMLALTAMAGMAIAWRCYHRIARAPIGAEGPPFSAFRFSDHAVWLLVAGLAVLLLPRTGLSLFGAPAVTWAANLLAVMAALYVARGLAVFASASRRTPRRIVAVVSVVAVFLWPFAAGGLVLLGLADSWVDFRRRLESPPTGGMDR
jgi:hypothetical protein